MALRKAAHAEIRVRDAEKALAFYTEIMGLSEVGRDGATVYLACGADQNYDLAVTPGGTGVAHFAFEVESEEDLATYRQRLAQAGIQVSERTDAEPGQVKALRFTAPSGHVMELALLADRPQYLHEGLQTRPRYRGFAPLDLDHITLAVQNVQGLAEFLRDVLDFRISDIFQPAPGVWGAAWLRVGEYHHDLAMLGTQNPQETLNHIAWQMDSFDHIKHALDMLARAGIPVEVGPGRHGLGGNLFAYFWEPGGNRFELSAEMPRVPGNRVEPKIWDNFPAAFSVWGHVPPESFARNS